MGSTGPERQFTSETAAVDLDQALEGEAARLELLYPVTLEALMLAFSWAADEAGYDLEQTNDVAMLILRAWRTVEKHGSWQRAGEPKPPAKLVRDEITEIIPVVSAGGSR